MIEGHLSLQRLGVVLPVTLQIILHHVFMSICVAILGHRASYYLMTWYTRNLEVLQEPFARGRLC